MLWRRVLIAFIGLAFVVVGIVAISSWRKQAAKPKFFPTAAPARSLSEIHQTWQQQAQAIVGRYDQDHNALAARDALVALTVAPEDQSAHLALVLALQAAIDQQKTASIQWDKAKQQLAP